MENAKDEIFTFNGRKAKSQLEIITFYLAKRSKDRISLAELNQELEKHGRPIGYNQLRASISNLHKLKLIEILDKGQYKVDPASLDQYLRFYLEGRVSLWAPRKSSAMPVGLRPTKKSIPVDAVRAIFAAYEKPLTTKDVVQIGQKYGLPIDAGTVIRYTQRNRAELIEDPLKVGKFKRFIASPRLFSDNAAKIVRLVDMIPQREKMILSRFNTYAAGQIDQLNKAKEQQTNGQTPGPQDKAKRPAGTAAAGPPAHANFAQIDMIRAIIAGHDRPLCQKDIVAIAKDRGLKVSAASVNFHRFHKPAEIKVIEKKGRTFYYTASPVLFEDHAGRIQLFCDIVPDLQETIKKRCGQDADPLAQSEEKESIDTATAQDQIPQSADLAQSAVSARSAESISMDDPNLMDAATVGAAIINYINKIKIDLKILRSAEPKTEESTEELKKKLESLSAALCSTNAEKGNYKFQVEKLQKIIDEKERRLAAKQKRIEDLENKLSLRNNSIPTTFKVDEVARITRLIKGTNIRS
jgi:hypothetical protein